MRQLSAQDTALLDADTTHSNANVSLLHIYNQSTAPGGKVRFKSILAQIENRLDRLPGFRQKLRRVPLELDRPYWIDDDNFDLEYHVRHIALPKPGDWRQFCIQVSRIHARPLDLDRPLWEIYVVEGLDSFLDLPEGSFALVAKTHHAAIDVDSGNEITMLLHDLAPQPPVAAPPPPWFPEAPPGLVSTLTRGVAHSLGASLRGAGPVARAVRQAMPAALTLAGELFLRPHHAPVTRFNAVVSQHRVFETRRFMLDEVKAIRGLVEGATVHDVVLAVCAGGLQRYLSLHAELPPASLDAMTPVYVRAAAAPDDARPEMRWLAVPLHTDLADPVQRLQAIHSHAAASEVLGRAVAATELTDPSRHLPAATLAVAGKMLGRATAGPGRRAPAASCTVSNVPGPTQPLYLCGARMTYFSAIMPIVDGMGLVFAVTSYDGQLVISPTSCRELMPDPAVFAQCLRDSFQELLALATVPPPPRGRASVRRKAATAPAPVKAAPRRASAPGRRGATSRSD
jgi:diacylglycerol O-acyltransferase